MAACICFTNRNEATLLPRGTAEVALLMIKTQLEEERKVGEFQVFFQNMNHQNKKGCATKLQRKFKLQGKLRLICLKEVKHA